MAQTARARGALVNGAAVPFLPDELVVCEILVRLPAKALLRCRAVCSSWRDLTSAVNFLLAHHRHQPSLPLVCFRSDDRRKRHHYDKALDAFDLSQSPAERRPVLRFNNISSSRPYDYKVHVSCDGLLVVSLLKNGYYICNPTTRQWISLPNLAWCTSVIELYPHCSSGEYRILYLKLGRVGINGLVYVLTVGSSVAPRGVAEFKTSGLSSVEDWRSVLLHGCLHWLYRYEGNVLIFDTVGESFRWMNGPTDYNNSGDSHLIETNGTLGISQIDRSGTMMKLWMLQNYGGRGLVDEVPNHIPDGGNA